MRPSTITRPVVWYCPSSRREEEDRARLAGRKTRDDGRAKEGGRAWSRKSASWEGVKGMAAGKIVWLLSGKARRESRSVVGVDGVDPPFGAGRQPAFSGRVPDGAIMGIWDFVAMTRWALLLLGWFLCDLSSVLQPQLTQSHYPTLYSTASMFATIRSASASSSRSALLRLSRPVSSTPSVPLSLLYPICTTAEPLLISLHSRTAFSKSPGRF